MFRFGNCSFGCLRSIDGFRSRCNYTSGTDQRDLHSSAGDGQFLESGECVRVCALRSEGNETVALTCTPAVNAAINSNEIIVNQLLLGLKDDLTAEPIAHNLADLQSVAISLHLFSVVADDLLQQGVRLGFVRLHRRKIFILGHQH